jgi:very-short-patch-repair endonuclease
MAQHVISTMLWPFAFLVVVAAVVIAVGLLLKKRRQVVSDDGPWPFYLRKPLTEPEQVLYHRLLKALPEHMVLAQVQLSRLLGVKKGENFASWYNRINQKSVDFVICRRDSTVLAVIELDDSTHDRLSRQTADAQKDKALASAGVKVIRWTAGSLPDEAAIRAAFVS